HAPDCAGIAETDQAIVAERRVARSVSIESAEEAGRLEVAGAIDGDEDLAVGLKHRPAPEGESAAGKGRLQIDDAVVAEARVNGAVVVVAGERLGSLALQ